MVVEQRREPRPGGVVDRELDELDAAADRRRGRRERPGDDAGGLRLRWGIGRGQQLLLQQHERAHASIAIGRGGAARNSSLKISSEIGPA